MNVSQQVKKRALNSMNAAPDQQAPSSSLIDTERLYRCSKKFKGGIHTGFKRGYTMIELIIIIFVISILAAFSFASFGNSQETRDATMVQSAQAALQSVVSQGAARMDVPPSQLNSTSVLNALKASFNTNDAGTDNPVQFSVVGTNSFQMTIPKGGRSATFTIGNSGDVTLSNLNNFTIYQVQNCVISRI